MTYIDNPMTYVHFFSLSLPCLIYKPEGKSSFMSFPIQKGRQDYNIVCMYMYMCTCVNMRAFIFSMV